jgi:hypothetical protein
MHKTKNLDDGYIGSGKHLKRAIKKYGLENFYTKILHVFDEEWKMKVAEKILVVPDKEISYNLCPGGLGGFGYINSKKLNRKFNIEDQSRGGNRRAERMEIDPKYREQILKKCSNSLIGRNPTKGMFGKKHSEEAKNKMSILASGNKNTQYGTCWITNGTDNKKIRKEDLDNWLTLGYYKGRI